MKKLLIGLLVLGSFSSFAKEFTVTIIDYSNMNARVVKTVDLPSQEIIIVQGNGAKCLIDSTVYNPSDKYSFIAIDLEADDGNRASSGGLIEQGSGVSSLILNKFNCIVQEK